LANPVDLGRTSNVTGVLDQQQPGWNNGVSDLMIGDVAPSSSANQVIECKIQ
jgi:hypothetical protein